MRSVLKAGTLSLLFCTSLLAFGQQEIKEVIKAPETKEEKTQMQTERMKKELNLTEEQYQSMKSEEGKTRRPFH